MKKFQVTIWRKGAAEEPFSEVMIDAENFSQAEEVTILDDNEEIVAIERMVYVDATEET